MLRLVHPPPPGGQGTRPPKGRRSAALSLTPDESRHLRAAIKNTARAYGGLDVLASVTGLSTDTLRHLGNGKGRRGSPAVALRVARAAGMSIEAVIGPALSEAGRCKACGSRIGEGRVAS